MKLESLDIEEKVNTVIEKRKENKILQFILGFCRLVEHLFSLKASEHIIGYNI